MFLSTTPNINITKLFCELHSMLLLLPTAAILEITVASEQRRGKLCHSISIQSTYFVRQLSVENVRVFIFVSVTPLYSSGGPFNMAAVGFEFPKNRCSIKSYVWDQWMQIKSQPHQNNPMMHCKPLAQLRSGELLVFIIW